MYRNQNRSRAARPGLSIALETQCLEAACWDGRSVTDPRLRRPSGFGLRSNLPPSSSRRRKKSLFKVRRARRHAGPIKAYEGGFVIDGVSSVEIAVTFAKVANLRFWVTFYFKLARWGSGLP
jgi:hypothetical protein